MPYPSSWDEDLAREVLERLSRGEPLAAICRDEGMPSTVTVRNWVNDEGKTLDGEPFGIAYAQARADGFDTIAAECLEIANTPIEGVTVKVKPVTNAMGAIVGEAEERTSEDMLGHRKLQIETRLKLLAKWDPKRYGELLKLGGDDNAPLTVKLGHLDDKL